MAVVVVKASSSQTGHCMTQESSLSRIPPRLDERTGADSTQLSSSEDRLDTA